jgi:hypothetical protein
MINPTNPKRSPMGFTLIDKTAVVTLPPSKHDNSVVILRGVAVPLASDVGAAFVADCARNREKIFSDARLQEKYDIDPSDWDSIVKNKTLRLAISAECERRMLSGIAAQESAAKIFTEAPEAMGSILRDNRASPRARVAASQELRATASVAEKSDADVDRVHIVINLGGDEKLVVDAPVKPLPPKEAREISDAETE